MPGMFTMSPEVQAYGSQQQQGQQQGPEALEQMFRQRFSSMAYQVMFTRFADIAQNIVTFKVLDQDADLGDALGVFIVVQDGSTIYIPTVLSDSQLKPMEVLYSKNLGVFLPLSTAWMQEIQRLSVSEMGKSQDMPPGATTDVNIRNLVNPPTAEYGRVGYAEDVEAGLHRMFTQLTKKASLGEPQFLNVLRNSPRVALDGLKLAFEKNPNMFAKLASCYGKTPLIEAMRDGYYKADSLYMAAKTACVTLLEKEGQLNILTKTASKEEIRRVFGKQAGEAFSTMLQQGVAIKDTRKGLDKIAVDVEGTIKLQGPGPGAGWLRIYSYDGPAENCLVVPVLETPSKWDTIHEVRETHEPSFPKHKHPKYLVISKDLSKVFVSENVAGDPIFPDKKNGLETSKALKALSSGGKPAVKAYGFFINASNAGITATCPLQVKEIMKANGTTTILSDEGVAYIQGPKDEALRGKMIVTHTEAGRTNVFLPKEARFVTIPGGSEDEAIWKYQDKMRQFSKSIITDHTRFRAWMKNIFKEAGASVAGVKSAGVNEWWIDGNSTPFAMADALHKVASSYHLTVEDAAKVLDNAQKYGHANTYILDAAAMNKLAGVLQKLSAEQPQSQEQPNQGRPDDKAPVGGGGGHAAPPPAGGDPGMGDGQASPPPPSPISPTDLAIGEALQSLYQQNQMTQQQNQASMQQMQQKMEMEAQQNQMLVQVLQGIQQRSMALSQGSGGQIPLGAEQSPLVAGQAIAPTPPPEPPPPAVMEPGQLTPDKVQQQVNPNFVDQAAAMNDQGVMDAGAIAMLSSAPVFQDITSAYIPQLEKSLDSIGRILLTLWIKERETKQGVGDEAFVQLEDRMRNLFKNMGELVLQLNRYGSAQNPADPQQQQQAQQGVQGQPG
jgi:hypothetical protein